MGFFDQISKKHEYGGSISYDYDIAIFASAIRTDMWMKLYDSLVSENKCKFKMFFCGHVQPDFDLPENLFHICSGMSAAPCVEIAYRHAMAFSAEHIKHFTDDCLMPPAILDNLLEDLRSSEKESIIGPAYTGLDPNGESVCLHIDTNDKLSPLVPLFQIMKKETAEKVGGLDKRFQAIYWDLDRLLRFHALGNIDFRVREDIRISEVPAYKNSDGLYAKYGKVDMKLLKDIWVWPNKSNPHLRLERKDKVQFYTLEELEFNNKINSTIT